MLIIQGGKGESMSLVTCEERTDVCGSLLKTTACRSITPLLRSPHSSSKCPLHVSQAAVAEP
jgi:hypothetical protein